MAGVGWFFAAAALTVLAGVLVFAVGGKAIAGVIFILPALMSAGMCGFEIGRDSG